MRSAAARLRSERGSAAAEFAVALPAVLLALMLGIGALGGAARQVALQDAAADAARLLGRGESASTAAAAVTSAVTGARTTTVTRGDLVCVTATLDAQIGRVISIPLRGESCALAGGR